MLGQIPVCTCSPPRVVPREQVQSVRVAVSSLLLRGQHKVRWRNENAQRRKLLTAAVAELDALHVVVVRSVSGMDPPSRAAGAVVVATGPGGGGSRCGTSRRGRLPGPAGAPTDGRRSMNPAPETPRAWDPVVRRELPRLTSDRSTKRWLPSVCTVRGRTQVLATSSVDHQNGGLLVQQECHAV